MSIDVTATAPTLHHKHPHVRPNPGNPLVQIKRDATTDAMLDQFAKRMAERQQLDPHGQPSKGGKLTDINAPTPAKPSLPMPQRFKKPEIWQDQAQKQHPLYRTTQSQYGARPPAIQEMPTKYFGNSHTFTNTFGGNMARDHGLNTSLTHSRVNAPVDEFGHF